MTVLNYRVLIDGLPTYQPVIRENGDLNLISIRCSNCKHYECEDLLKTTNINMAVSCGKFTIGE